MKIGTLTVDINADSRGLDKGVDGVRKKLDELDRRSKVAQKSIGGMVTGLKSLAAILAGGALVNSTKNVTLEFQAIDRTLKAATGSAEAGARAFSFVSGEADRLGLNLRSSAAEFAKLSAAAKGTALEGQATRDIFTAVATASTALGLSAEQTGGALKAIEQMISKGTVSAEELRGQLGERLPGAFQLAAKSMGVTTEELGKMLQKGEVMADDLLPKLAKELEGRFAEAAEEAADGAVGAFNRLSNSVDDLMVSIGESGLIDAMADVANFIGQELIPAFKFWGEQIGLIETNVNRLNEMELRIRQEAALDEIQELNERFIKLNETAAQGPLHAKAMEEPIKQVSAELDEQVKKYAEIVAKLEQIKDASGGGDSGSESSAVSKMTEDQAKMLEAIRNRFKTEQELLAEKVLFESEILNQALGDTQERWELERQLKAEHEAALTDIERQEVEERMRLAKQQADMQMRFEEQIRNMKFNVANDAVALAKMVAGESKGAALAILATEKALAIASTFVNTQVAAMRALAELGPVVGAAAAGKIEALGKIKMGLIAATGLVQAGGLGGGGGSSSVGAVSGGGQAGGQAAAQAFDPAPTRRVLVEGIDPNALISGRQLIEILNEAQQDGPALITVSR